jgi:tryptophanase
MMKITILALTVIGAAYAQTAAQSNFAAAVGDAIGKVNLGGCLAFQDDQADTTTTCYQSCLVTSGKVATAFDAKQYTGGVYNSGELMSQL